MRCRSRRLPVALAAVAVLSADSSYAAPPVSGEKETPSVDLNVIHRAVTGVSLPGEPAQPPPKGLTPFFQGVPPLSIDWSALSFDDNFVNTGAYAIPPDPNGAAGPNHVVNICNKSIQWYDKSGVLQHNQSLQNFFGPLGPPLGTLTGDPKVTYDQYSDRFVAITHEATMPNGSYILVAVSKTPDPNAGWWFLGINSAVPIDGELCFADYPGLAVDDKAIYVTNNMFTFSGFSYKGPRLWIIHKAPFYSGGGPVWTIHDMYTAVGVNPQTTMPAHMYGPVPAGLGAYQVAYSGFTEGGFGGSEFTSVIAVLDPLGTGGGPFFLHQFVGCGDIEDVGGLFGWPSLPSAPQSGTNELLWVFNRRTMDAVWRNDQLYVTATINPNSGPDAGHTTAHWWRIDTSAGVGSMVTADQGNVGAEDLGADTYTFFPSVAVDVYDNMAIGFAASNTNIFPGAYYTGRLATDAPGMVQSTGVLQAGTDYYYRTFGGSRNSWGDYTGMAIDPVNDATFWVFNQHAMSRGTVLPEYPNQDGRWDTHWGSFDLAPPVSVAITGFEARALPEGVELTASFRAEFDRFRVNIYRQDDRLDQPVRYKSIEMNGSEDLLFVDRLVEPGKSYHYHIGVVDRDGEYYSRVVKVTLPTVATVLEQNEPNPFNPSTTIAFTLPQTLHVSLIVYDATGRAVSTLANGVTRFGSYRVVWDGTDDSGQPVGSGVYFYRLEAGLFSESKKMVLTK